MAKFFDLKYFNPEAFGKYMESVPDTRRNKLLESGAVVRDADLAKLFSSQTGSYFATRVFYGNPEGDADNYDGQTNITTESSTTYKQGVFVYGRAKGFMEKDFSKDITSGVDFAAAVRNKLLKYWNDKDQDTILCILKGIFGMTGADNKPFVDGHTNDITGAEGDMAYVGPTSLNDTIQKACGDNKDIFSMAIMHSQVATNLENLNLLQYLKYTDALGVERSLSMATWNGRLVIIDDSMPHEVKTIDGEKVTIYETYVLGEGAIAHEPVGAATPYEMARDAATNGGETTLYTRRRHAVAVNGISYAEDTQQSLSPTNAELKNGKAWNIIKSADGKTWDHKAIPIARIISRG